MRVGNSKKKITKAGIMQNNYKVDLNILKKNEKYRKLASFSNSAVYVPENSEYPFVSIICNSENESPFSITSKGNIRFHNNITVEDEDIFFGSELLCKKNTELFDSRYRKPPESRLNHESLKKNMSLFFMYSKTGIPYDKFFNVEPVFQNENTDGLLRKMEGYGSGLTPEGDDFILGYNIGMELSGRADQKYLNNNMNRYSANLDVLFSNFLFPEFLLEILEGLYSKSGTRKNRILAAITKTSRFGNSTGFSICDGLFYALSHERSELESLKKN